MSRLVTLGEVLRHRKGSIIIDDAVEYKRCRVQLHRRGVEVRDIVPGTVIKTKKQQLCKAGDFIVAEMDAKFGGYGFLGESLEGAIVSSHYYLFEVITKKMLPEYLAVINKTDILQNQIKAKGSTNYSAVRPVDVLGWTIPLPSLAEQQRIIDEVEVTEKEQQLLLPEFDQQLAHLTQLRQALLREAMQGQLLPQDPIDEPAAVLLKKIQEAKAAVIKGGKSKAGTLFLEEAETVEELFDIPASWAWCTLDDIFVLITDGTHQTPSYTEQGRPFLSAQNIKPFRFMPEVHRYVSEEAYQEYTRIKKPELGDLLIARVGAGIGECAVIDKQIDFAFYVSLGLVKLVSGFLSADYLAYMINGPFGVAYSKNNIASKGGSAGNFNLTKIRTFPIPLPPLAEQHRIVAELAQLLQQCDALEQRIRESRRLAEQLLATALREALAPPAGTALAATPEVPAAEATTSRRRGRPPRQLVIETELNDLFNQPF